MRLISMARKAPVVLGLIVATSVLSGCFGGGSAHPSVRRPAEPPSAQATALPAPSTEASHDPYPSHATRRPERVPPSTTSTIPTCLAGNLRAVIIDAGSNGSQPFDTIALRNVGPNTCSLDGYPTLTACGHQRGGADHRLQIRVRDGAIYARPDPGPHVVSVATGQRASFSIGTADAYQGGAHPIFITRLEITAPGSAVAVALRLRMPATRPVGKAIPIGVTALRASM